MRTDHLTFRRATSISVIGLSLQLALAALFFLYAVFALDGLAWTAAMVVSTGVIVWLGLALAFHQQKLERLEAIEAEAFAAAGGGQASVFDAAGDDLRVQSRRLAWMHRILLPVLSVVYGAALLATGVVRVMSGQKIVASETFRASQQTGWAIAVGLGAAVVGFVFARFVAGMAKQKVWANLRGGAAVSVGVAIFGLAIAVGHFLAFLGNENAVRYLHVVLPGFATVLGAEVFFNFVLNIYRPRRAGEIPRPAFDSRILGFLAAPDRLAKSVGEAISYQFGFDVTTSWFYRLLSRTLLLLVGFGLAMLWGLSSLAVVKPDSRGLIVRFGALQREVGSGLHVKWPWPIESLETHPALRVNEISVATPPPTAEGPILWTTTHVKAGDEVFFLVQPTMSLRAGEGGGDLALVSVEIPLHYTVSSLEKFERLAPPGMRDPLLKAVAARQAIEHLSSRSVEEILGYGRLSIGQELHKRISAAFDRLDAGVDVLFVGVAGVHPPQEEDVAQAFERVVSTEQVSQASVERARAEAIRARTRVAGDVAMSSKIVAEIDELDRLNTGGADQASVLRQQQKIDDLIAGAGGEAEVLLLRARADRWQRHMEERGRAARHIGMTLGYRGAPAVFRVQYYLDTLADLALDARVYITAFESAKVRLNLEDVLDVASVPTPPKPKEQ